MSPDWQKWELQIGGKWPGETYDAITVRATKCVNSFYNYQIFQGETD